MVKTISFLFFFFKKNRVYLKSGPATKIEFALSTARAVIPLFR